MSAEYDSTHDTEAHIGRVQELLHFAIEKLATRADVHDQSKLEEPEKSAFDYATPRLKGSTYGSDEYKGFLADLKPALDHHYAANSHHPEHFERRQSEPWLRAQAEKLDDNDPVRAVLEQRANEQEAQINGMSLLDLMEMLCDWKAAGERHADGSMERSLSVNVDRFKISPQLMSILRNTATELRWLNPPTK